MQRTFKIVPKKIVSILMAFLFIILLILTMLTTSAIVVYAAQITLTSDNIVEYPIVTKKVQYGQPFSEMELSGGKVMYNGVEVVGTFEVADPTAMPMITGDFHPVDLKFVPENDEYSSFIYDSWNDMFMNFYVEVLLITPIYDKPIASEIKPGNPLSMSSIEGNVYCPYDNSKSICGSWHWVDSRTIIEEDGEYEAYFQPEGEDATYYSKVNCNVLVTVEKTIVQTSIYEMPKVPEVTYNGSMKWSDVNLIGGSAVEKGSSTPVEGSFSISDNWKKRVVEAGTHEIDVIFTPADTEAYTIAECKVPVTVNKGTVKFVDESGNEIVPEITLDRALNVGSDLNGYLKQYLNVSSCSFNWEETEGYKEKIKPGTHEYTVKTIIDDPNYERYGNLTFKVIVNKEKIEGTVQGDVGGKKLYFKEAYELYGTFDIKYFINGKEEGIIKINVGEVFNIPQNKSGVYTYEITYNGTADDYYDVTVINPAPEDIKLSHNVTVNGVETPYTYGAPVTVTAPANEKPYYVFTGWSEVKGDIGDAKADTAEVKFTMPDEDVEFTATYEFDFIEFIKWIFETIANWFKTVFAFIGGAFK